VVTDKTVQSKLTTQTQTKEVKKVEQKKPKNLSIKCELVYEDNNVHYNDSCSLLSNKEDGTLVLKQGSMYFSICKGGVLDPSNINNNCHIYSGGQGSTKDLL